MEHDRTYGDTTLGRIKSAYASAQKDMPPDYEPLPAWEALTPAIREAIIHVYSAGRVDRDREARTCR